MKKSLALALLVSCALVASNRAKAQENSEAISVCIHDEFGYVWNVTLTSKVNGAYIGKGTVDLGGGLLWDATITWDSHTGSTSFEGDNPDADGCVSGFTDYFTYSGTATASYAHHVLTYNGSGTWQSYCVGSVVGVGLWTATDCAHKNATIDPNGPARKH